MGSRRVHFFTLPLALTLSLTLSLTFSRRFAQGHPSLSISFSLSLALSRSGGPVTSATFGCSSRHLTADILRRTCNWQLRHARQFLKLRRVPEEGTMSYTLPATFIRKLIGVCGSTHASSPNPQGYEQSSSERYVFSCLCDPTESCT